MFFLALLFIAASWTVTIRGRDAWPFSRYPMFSARLRTEGIIVYRIALEFPDGTSRWWRPHYYKLQQQFGLEFARTTGLPLGSRIEGLHELRLRIESCLANDSAAVTAIAWQVVERRPVAQPEGGWKSEDRVVQRTSLARGFDHTQ